MKPILKSLYQNSRNKEIKDLIFDAFNKDYIMRFYVAENPKTLIHVLEYLSKDENIGVRCYVAGNSSTPISILEKLSIYEQNSVRKYVTLNQNTPIHILEKLSNDEDYSIRKYVSTLKTL